MFDAPADAWYVWIGLAAASVAVLGTALALPAEAPPPADRVAGAIDAVAASDYAAVDRVDLSADRIELGSERIALKSGDRTARATLEYGPVVPVRTGRLARLLAGARPSTVFADPDGLRSAIAAARAAPGRWRPAPDRLTIRRISWGDVSATLVG